MILGSGGLSDIDSNFEILAKFRDMYSGFSYDVVGHIISNTLPDESFLYEGTSPNSYMFSDVRGVLGISPAAFVEGIHPSKSALFGIVAVNVIPQPSSLAQCNNIKIISLAIYLFEKKLSKLIARELTNKK